MKQTCSITDKDGLTISLEISAPPSFFESSVEPSQELVADHSLASSAFAQVLPQLSTQLLQVVSVIDLALRDSFCKCLQEQIDELRENYDKLPDNPKRRK